MERSYKDFLAGLADKKRIPPETELAYFKIIKNPKVSLSIKKEAKKRIADNHIPFVISVANKYSCNNSTRGELINIGVTGLMRAIDSYSPDTGNKFISYAVWWIRQSIYSYIFNNDDLIHIPQNERIRLKKLTKESKRTGVPIEELCTSRKEFDAVSSAMTALNIHSFDAPVHVDYDGPEVTLADVIPGADMQKDKESEEFKSNINTFIELVNGRDKDILSKTYGMEGKIYTFKEIGEMYGKSTERIRQYKNQAIRRLAAAAKKSPIYREIAGLPKSNLVEPVAAGAPENS